MEAHIDITLRRPHPGVPVMQVTVRISAVGGGPVLAVGKARAGCDKSAFVVLDNLPRANAKSVEIILSHGDGVTAKWTDADLVRLDAELPAAADERIVSTSHYASPKGRVRLRLRQIFGKRYFECLGAELN